MTHLERLEAILDDLGVAFALAANPTDQGWVVRLNGRELRFDQAGSFLGFVVENEWRAYIQPPGGGVTLESRVTQP